MGPPPFGDGNKTDRPNRGQRRCPSMGPPPFGDGNTRNISRYMTAVTLLQWGHRLSAMETIMLHWQHGSTTPPFNGATAFRRWKPEGRGGQRPSKGNLQWGHRLSAMETSMILPGAMSWPRSFNGATAFRRWKPTSTRPARLRTSTFNGATAFRRWKPDSPERGSHPP